MTRVGTVLVFKAGVTKRDAVEALARLNDVLEPGFLDRERGPGPDGWGVRVTALVHEFNDEHGGPVWYVP